MMDKVQMEMAKTLWEQSRAAARQAQDAWAMVLKSQQTLLNSMRPAGAPFSPLSVSTRNRTDRRGGRVHPFNREEAELETVAPPVSNASSMPGPASEFKDDYPDRCCALLWGLKYDESDKLHPCRTCRRRRYDL